MENENLIPEEEESSILTLTDEKGEDIDFSAPSCVLASNPTVYDEFYKIAKRIINK